MKRASIPFILSFLLLLPLSAGAEVGAGMGLSPWDGGPAQKKEKQPRPPDAFIKLLAERFGQKQDDLALFWNHGYGRNELIKMLLISRQANKDIKELVRKRDKGTRLSRMAEEYRLDYAAILNETKTIRKELDYQVLVSTTAAAVSAGTAIKYTSSISTPTVTNKENDH